MAKKQTENQEEVIVDVVGTYNRTEQFIEDNQKSLTIIVLAVAAIIGGYFAYTRLYLVPLEEEASKEMWKAEQYFKSDSLDLALTGDGNFLGFEDIVDEYGATQVGKLANYYIGLIYMRKGEYEVALQYLGDFSSDDVMLSTLVVANMGDCYSELGDYEEAYDYYLKAVGMNENNFTTPIYLMKAAAVAEELGNYKDALQHYQTIRDDYADTQEGRSIEKYIARAELMASNN
jgi:tetratricopeptide (TPR) repeat protein